MVKQPVISSSTFDEKRCFVIKYEKRPWGHFKDVESLSPFELFAYQTIGSGGKMTHMFL